MLLNGNAINRTFQPGFGQIIAPVQFSRIFKEMNYQNQNELLIISKLLK